MQMWTPEIACWLLITAMGVVRVVADPQTNLLNVGCSSYNATDKALFFSNLNTTFGQLQVNLSSGDAVRFAKAQQSRTSDPVYAMVQCRNYLSKADCLACYAVAEKQIRNCSASNGARVIYDGCFLRYESNNFYDQTTLPGNANKCGNKTATQASAFASAVSELVADLITATPKIKGFFAATKKEVSGSSGRAVYGVAQCAETVSPSGCLQCLQVAQNNIQGCPPNTDGRAFDAGCFLRYSDTAFFADNQTTNIAPFLEGRGSKACQVALLTCFLTGGSDSKKAIFGGVGGGVGLLLLIGVILVCYRHSRKPREARKGDILGATELQGPMIFRYKDLKLATKNFSEESKLGEGGFGHVYKGTLQNGKIVAVKKLFIGQSSRAKADFATEVKLIGNVHHRNLVRLLGCCSKGAELLLIYEYMANSSLDKFLYGYTAPEYATYGQLSVKVDTYSFGVVVLEIVSGRKSTEMKAEAKTPYLLDQARKLYESNLHMELVDERIDPNEYEVEEAKKIIEIGLMCTQEVALRPTMSEVVVMLLSNGMPELKMPTGPLHYQFDTERRLREASFSTTSASSNATVSITQPAGR
ncbi:Gnk2-homologous domain [Dillenia turbinata]|uniref:Gnk2-homologous domain n=1 Tax=Dillenia turbinata TaxID=194707 RepID=A0AAN8UKW7_9MAGN